MRGAEGAEQRGAGGAERSGIWEGVSPSPVGVEFGRGIFFSLKLTLKSLIFQHFVRITTI